MNLPLVEDRPEASLGEGLLLLMNAQAQSPGRRAAARMEVQEVASCAPLCCSQHCSYYWRRSRRCWQRQRRCPLPKLAAYPPHPMSCAAPMLQQNCGGPRRRDLSERGCFVGEPRWGLSRGRCPHSPCLRPPPPPPLPSQASNASLSQRSALVHLLSVLARQLAGEAAGVTWTEEGVGAREEVGARVRVQARPTCCPAGYGLLALGRGTLLERLWGSVDGQGRLG